MGKIFSNKWVKFSIVSILYVAFVIWLGSFWWLLGLIVIFDIYITKKVHWDFWNSRTKKPNSFSEWLDAIIFAVIAATFIKAFFIEAYVIPSSSMENSLLTGDYLFVSKLKYGPRVPQTPLTIPLTHNVLFGGVCESYSTLIQNDYRRMKGYGKVERFDEVVFNFPNGDTVLKQSPGADYYAYVRSMGREYVTNSFGPIIVRPMDKKDNYVKRCVAVHGDILEVKDGVVYTNGKREPYIKGVRFHYVVITDGTQINPKILEKYGISSTSISFDSRINGYLYMYMNDETAAEIAKLPNVISCLKQLETEQSTDIFPHSPNVEGLAFARDNYGPIQIPFKGMTIELNEKNICLYKRAITKYENNAMEIDANGKVFINGEETTSYTFKMDYYFMMGDNRHNSLDSRFWGFVPEDHIVGKPILVWLSIDRSEKFPKCIRWNRAFKTNFKK